MSQPVSRPLDKLRSLRHSAAGHHQFLRFAVAGGTVALVYLSLGVLLSGPLGLPFQVAIPIAYFTGVALHYCLQRWFVFAHQRHFELESRGQLGRYLLIAGGQYVAQALINAAAPGLLGLSHRTVFVAVAVLTPIVTFVLLRAKVFHGEPEKQVV